MIGHPRRSPLFPYPPLSRSLLRVPAGALAGLAKVDFEELRAERLHLLFHDRPRVECLDHRAQPPRRGDGLERSEEHTSELQSPCNLVCRLLLEKKKTHKSYTPTRSHNHPASSHVRHLRR